ncbi:Fatty-acid amide hydrolase 2-A like protein [Argiope bruennichi]|uniref:Fatty-acid amide hydrolase 2-A like protein n=1 Tax=Argiope bruennichi TaxID=94029 RepID=A0A8T0EPN3_ARGBR|nr:Fatty-acid amide hydrolase 2-A like protein [Argiope bruennichi]
MEFTMDRMLHLMLTFARFVLHYSLFIWYGGKGKVVPPVKNPLLLKSATKLAREIREGKCKSKDVIQAYIDRILEVEPYINATAERCFEDALMKAREVDALVASGKYTKEQLSIEKPLLGIPVSIKCLLHVKNMPYTCGCLLFADLRAIEDAPTVAALKEAGAIVTTTTNVPELGIDMESGNKFYGTTCNPYDTNRTCGGSSGGEAALISAGGSLLGLGNDLAGSLRIPAHFTGIFSHKPSKGLVSNRGAFPFGLLGDPEECCNPELNKYITTGPMCRYAEDLIISMKVLALDNEVRMKFDHPVDFKRVKIYYLTEIQSPLVAPVEEDIADALKKAVSYFEKQYNIKPKEVKMPYLFDINKCTLSVLQPLFRDIKKSTIGRKEFGLNERMEFMKSLFGKSKIRCRTFLNFNSGENPLIYKESQSSYYQNMIENWMGEFKALLDEDSVLLMPTLPFTAPYHLETYPLLLSACYLSLFNILGLPATHCTLGLTKQGLPCGIQVVGCQNNDPLTIACAVELERAFGGWKLC